MKSISLALLTAVASAQYKFTTYQGTKSYGHQPSRSSQHSHHAAYPYSHQTSQASSSHKQPTSSQHYSHQQPTQQYSQQHHSQPAAQSTNYYHAAKPTTYHSSSHQATQQYSHAPTHQATQQYSHAPTHQATQQHTHAPAQQYYGAHTHQASNPWSSGTDTTDKTGWYSPYSQYSPPKIQYKPDADHLIFAICELTGGAAGTGSIQIAQNPHQAAVVRTNFVATTLAAEAQTFTVTINEYGKVGDRVTCDQVGDEFNPLTERSKYGQVNPYQDPARGRIAEIVTDATGNYMTVNNAYLLQNIDGQKGILGRSITLTNKVSGAKQCCAIARDELPASLTPTTPTYPYQAHATYGHGHH